MTHRIHPLIAHLPVGLFIGAGLLALLGLFFKRGLFKELLVWVLGVGILATIPNIYTGILDSKNILIDKSMYDLMVVHTRTAYMMMALFSILFLWITTRKRRMPYLEYVAIVVFMVFGCSAVIYQSFTGYQLVYMHGANVAKNCPRPTHQEETPENASLFKY